MEFDLFFLISILAELHSDVPLIYIVYILGVYLFIVYTSHDFALARDCVRHEDTTDVINGNIIGCLEYYYKSDSAECSVVK